MSEQEGDLPSVPTVSLLTREQQFRSELLRLHNSKINVSGFRGERACHRKPVRHNKKRIGIQLRQAQGGKSKAFYTQIQRSNAYTCPIAHLRNRASKSADIAHLLVQHTESGGVVLSGTFTMATSYQRVPGDFFDPSESFRFSDEWERAEEENGGRASIHRQKQTSGWLDYLASLDSQETSYASWDLTRRLDASTSAVAFAFAARELRAVGKRAGVAIAGNVIATEIEVSAAPSSNPDFERYWGRTRNHVHIHYLLFLDNPEVSPKQVRQLKQELYRRWAAGVRQHGYRSHPAGADLQPVQPVRADLLRVGRYLAKGTTYTSDNETRLGASFWDALRDIATHHDYKAVVFWQNLEGAVRGRKLLRISPALFKRYELAEERARRLEEWRASQPTVETVAFFDRTDWYLTTSIDPKKREELLVVAERQGAEGTRSWLEEQGIPYFLTSEATDELAEVA